MKCKENFLVFCKSQECETCVLAMKSSKAEETSSDEEKDSAEVFKPDIEFF